MEDSKCTTQSLVLTRCKIWRPWNSLLSAIFFHEIFHMLGCGTLNLQLTWCVDSPWTKQKSLQTTINCFSTWAWLAWNLPVTGATCIHNFLYHYLIKFVVGGYSWPFFYMLPNQLSQIYLNVTPAHVTLFWVQLPSDIWAILWRPEITSHTCVQRNSRNCSLQQCTCTSYFLTNKLL
jgi:hypothetical protein